MDLENVWQAPIAELPGGTLTLSSILTGIAIIVVFVILAAIAGRWVRRALARTSMREGGRFALEKMVRYALWFIGVTVALNTMGLSLGAVLAASTVVLVGLGFGLQEIAKNFISGLILLVEQPIRRGDFIQVKDTYGVVEDIRLRATHVLTRDAVTIIVPNNDLIVSQVVNHSTPEASVRVAIRVGVAYGSDVQKVKRLLLEAAATVGPVMSTPAPVVRFDDFGESSLDFTLLVWIPDPAQDLVIASDVRFEIDKRFRENGVQIPFPQRDLHIKTGSTLTYTSAPQIP